MQFLHKFDQTVDKTNYSKDMQEPLNGFEASVVLNLFEPTGQPNR